MWTSKNRVRYDRSKLRYPSDLTDDEWLLVEPLIPPGKTGGGKRTVIMREVVNGLMYILSTGCQWRAIPKDLPPKSSVYDYFDLWAYDGTLARIHHALYERCREQAQREARSGDRDAGRWASSNFGSGSIASWRREQPVRSTPTPDILCCRFDWPPKDVGADLAEKLRSAALFHNCPKEKSFLGQSKRTMDARHHDARKWLI